MILVAPAVSLYNALLGGKGGLGGYEKGQKGGGMKRGGAFFR